MARIEIDLPMSDAVDFDRVFWSFCSERESDLEVHLTACDLGRGHRRTVSFEDPRQATAFQDCWGAYQGVRQGP